MGLGLDMAIYPKAHLCSISGEGDDDISSRCSSLEDRLPTFGREMSLAGCLYGPPALECSEPPCCPAQVSMSTNRLQIMSWRTTLVCGLSIKSFLRPSRASKIQRVNGVSRRLEPV